MTRDLDWEKLPAEDREELRLALTKTDLVRSSLRRIHGVPETHTGVGISKLDYIAEGGAMRVYRLWTEADGYGTLSFALKVVKSARVALVRWNRTRLDITEDERVEEQMGWMIDVTERVNRGARSIYPVFGGYWKLDSEAKGPIRLMTEQFVEGPSLSDKRRELENLMMTGQLNLAQYTVRRTELDRKTVSAFILLWNALNREVFSSDPSPWNVKILGDGADARVMILDLHLLAEPAPLTFVIERFQSFYGLRDEVVRGSILPGIVDALGAAEANALFREMQPGLLELSQNSKQRIGTDLYATLRRALDDWLTGSTQ